MTSGAVAIALSAVVSACCAGAARGQFQYTALDHPLAGRGGTAAYDVDGSRIVGTFFDAGGVSRGFVYDGGNWSVLDHPAAAGPRGTTAYGVWDGLVCGTYVDSSGRTFGYVYDGATFTTLARPPMGLGPVDTFARGIYDGTVVGYSIEGPLARGFVYDNGVFSDLIVPGAVGTFPDDTDSGRVVGFFEDPVGTHGFFSLVGGVPVPVDHPLGVLGTFLTGVDGPNYVGNYLGLPDPRSRGFLFNGTTYLPIDVPGAIDTTVNGIDGLTVVGSYVDAAGAAHGFLATVPEPAAAGSAALAVGLLALRRGRSARTSKTRPAASGGL